MIKPPPDRLKIIDLEIGRGACKLDPQHGIPRRSQEMDDTTLPVPNGFINVQKAGEGASANVIFALPRDQLPKNDQESEPSIKYLKTKLLVVKISNVVADMGTGSDIEEEAIVVKAIEEAAATSRRDLSRRFPNLTSSGILFGRIPWMAINAVFGKTLYELQIPFQRQDRYVPRPFVFHVYVQLLEATAFLHAKGIAHLDLHSGNILLEQSPTQDGTCVFPNLVLIDFGKSVMRDRASLTVGFHGMANFDVARIYDIIERLACKGQTDTDLRNEPDEDWRDFIIDIRRKRLQAQGKDPETWPTNTPFEDFRALAALKRNEGTPAEVEEIAEALDMKDFEEDLNVNLRRALQRHKALLYRDNLMMESR